MPELTTEEKTEVNNIATILNAAKNDAAPPQAAEPEQLITDASDLYRKCEILVYTNAYELLNAANQQEPLTLDKLQALWQEHRKTVIGTAFDLTKNPETPANALFLRCYKALKLNAKAKDELDAEADTSATDLIEFFFGKVSVVQAEIHTNTITVPRQQLINFKTKSYS